MQRIELGAMESNDLIRILDYAKDKKREDMKLGKITVKQYEMETESIKKLRNKINKKYANSNIIQLF